ncbi:MAG: PH domain-containing protein [Pedobacter sp.]|nr:MAG: PH domain-containing protein [Pedobacter sp.]
MSFENPAIETLLIPRAEEVILEPVNSNYYKVILYNQLIFWGIFALAIAAALFLIDELRSMPIISGIIFTYLITLFLNIWLSRLSFINKAYAIRQHDIIYQTGWLVKRMHICPFTRIQHCSINSGIFERKFGLAKLSVYSAGGDDSDISIPGLTISRAQDLRELIIQKSAMDGTN